MLIELISGVCIKAKDICKIGLLPTFIPGYAPKIIIWHEDYDLNGGRMINMFEYGGHKLDDKHPTSKDVFDYYTKITKLLDKKIKKIELHVLDAAGQQKHLDELLNDKS